MDLRAIAEGLYVVDSRLAMVGVVLPLRCCLMRLRDGSVLMHSPIAFDAQMEERIDVLGPVSVIVAPSGFHHAYAKAAQSRWPRAELWASRAIRQKAPELEVAQWFGDDTWPYTQEVSAFTLAGAPAIEETLFLHHPTRTLVVTDLVFNILQPEGFLARLAYGLFGTYRKFASSRFYGRYVSDKPAFGKSLEPVFQQSLERIVMAHGEIVEGDQLVERLRQATARLWQ